MTETLELCAQAEGVRVCRDGGEAPLRRSLAREHRLSLLVDGEPFALIHCTPSQLRQLALGRLCTAGRIAGAEDVLSLRFSESGDRAEAALRPGAGAGGKRSPRNRSVWRSEDIFRLSAALRAAMPLHDETYGTHGAALMYLGETLCCCEDIGRHNAIDKAVGTALERDIPLGECILYTTGRIAADIVEKTASAGIKVLVSRALPTAEALELAGTRGITLIGRAWEDQFEVYTR